nr:hypothetical protein [Tanacetum cinerariifolium]
MPRTPRTHDGEAGSSRSKRPRQHEIAEEVLLPQVHHEFLLWEGCSRDAKSRVHEAELDEEIFTSVAWIRAFNKNEPIYTELCHQFYSTYEFDEVCADDELQSKKIIKFRLGGRAHSLTLLKFARRLGLYQAVELEEDGFNVYFEGGLHNDDNFNAHDYWLSISREDNLGLSRSHTFTISLGNCEMDEEEMSWDSERESNLLWDLDSTTLRDLIDFESKLILEDPQPCVPRVGIPRPLRASMHDLYDKMGRMEIRQDKIERMEYRQSYHWDRYHRVFEHMVGVYSVPLQGAYNPPGYAQLQYDQYYQQYPPPPPQYQQQQDDDEYCRDDTRANIYSEALRKSDQVYQNFMKNTLALNHKLDELIESLKSLPKKTNDEDLAKHEYRKQQDLGFETTNFKSQSPPSFDVYIPPVTYLKEVEETIKIPMEVEPFDQTQLEDVDLNTCSQDLFLIPKEVLSVDEPEPQLLPIFSPLDVNLGDKKGTNPPINPYSPGSFMMKVIVDEEKPITSWEFHVENSWIMI